MKRLLALLAGALGLHALLRRRQHPQPAVETEHARQLRAKLAESRVVEEDRPAFEAGETPVDETDVAARRADVHTRARRAIDELSG
jgi:hypothetical protein